MRVSEATFQLLERDLVFTASRSSGPGGQNVNKVNSRVTLHFDIVHSPHLSSSQKSRIAEFLATRVTKSGVLRFHAQRHRRQEANRADLMVRFAQLIRASLAPPPVRVKTKVPRKAIQKRLSQKRQRAKIKQNRAAARQQDE